MKTKKVKIKQIFKEHNLSYGWEEIANGMISVHIEWGDWKHEHLALDQIMCNNGFKVVGEIPTEEDGSDTYSSTHIFLEI